MRAARLVWLIGLVLMVFVALECAGCTMHFKAKECEFDTVANATYEMNQLDFLYD